MSILDKAIETVARKRRNRRALVERVHYGRSTAVRTLTLTDKARRWLALEALFGPRPTVDDVARQLHAGQWGA